jgi:hypothetical protein
VKCCVWRAERFYACGALERPRAARSTRTLGVMDIHYSHLRFWTARFEDKSQGCEGFKLHREAFGKTEVVAQATYWDAAGCFVFGIFNGDDVPFEIAEAAMAEARREIKVR